MLLHIYEIYHYSYIIVVFFPVTGRRPKPVDSNLLYYEPVFYDTQQLHHQHINSHRVSEDHPVILEFHAFSR